MLQKLNYNENPIYIPNPDMGPYRGRWQNIPPKDVDDTNSPFGITPEVDHRVPIDESSVLYHGRQVPPVEGDDIALTEFFNGKSLGAAPYVGGTGVAVMPSIAFMGFDLVNFSSNAFLSAKAAFGFMDDGKFTEPDGSPRTGKTGPLTDYALNYIRGLLQKVREGDGVAFVKFSYDGNGFNYIEPFKYPHLKLTQGLIHGPEPTQISDNNHSVMCDVPGHTDKNWIEYHIWQLKPIFFEFEDIIMCVKTGMIGAWGEQHSSPVSRDPKTYKYLFDAYLEAVPKSRSLLTHAGGFLAWYNMTYGTNYSFYDIDTMPVPKRGTPEARFGFFNDSYAAGSEDLSDNGSLSEGGDMLKPDTLKSDSENGIYGYDRYRIIKWINKQNNFLQGEGGIRDCVFARMPGAIIEAGQLRTTALNIRHGDYSLWAKFLYNEPNVTAKITFPKDPSEKDESCFTGPSYTAFFDPVYDGKTGLEYFRDRMGYRLVLREAHLPETIETTGCLEFKGKIQNVGFANIINEKSVTVILKSKDASVSAKINLDPRDWTSDINSRADNISAWRDMSFNIQMTDFGILPVGEYDIFLKINDPKEISDNKRCVRFANYDIWDAELGANRIGKVKVTKSIN